MFILSLSSFSICNFDVNPTLHCPPPLSEISSFAPQVLHFEGPQLVNNSYLHLYFTVLLKIIGSATVFLLLGALVPWSPITQKEYLSFQWWK